MKYVKSVIRGRLVMKSAKRYIVIFLMLTITFLDMPVGQSVKMEQVYAASLPTVGDLDTVVCKKKAQVLIPWWYQKRYSFSSSNKKVATVNAKGILTAHRLGETNVIVKCGKEKVVYEITVVPEKKTDVRLNQEILMSGQKVQLKLISDKYDTSQVHLKFDTGYSEITSKGWCKGIDEDEVQKGTITYWYGLFSNRTTLYVYHPEKLFASMTRVLLIDYIPNDVGLDAGEKYTALTNEDDFLLKKNPTLAWARNKGLEFYLDGKRMTERVVYKPGEHVIKIVAGKKKYEKKINVGYSIKDVVEKRDVTGYSTEIKEVFVTAFTVIKQVTHDGMSDEQKVKAIHDYLIYSANYVNNGDYKSAEAWAFSAEGVLVRKEGVCESYAVAFYLLAKIAGLDCHYVRGGVTTSDQDHAWNRVKVDGEWYYIDCTWDDPVGGGQENYDYYLSKTVWSNHIAEREDDLIQDKKEFWTAYYLTGDGYKD